MYDGDNWSLLSPLPLSPSLISFFKVPGVVSAGSPVQDPEVFLARCRSHNYQEQTLQYSASTSLVSPLASMASMSMLMGTWALTARMLGDIITLTM